MKTRLLNLVVIFLSTYIFSATFSSGEAQAKSFPSQEAQKIALGKLIFNDKNLSVPSGQACASCHSGNTGHAEKGAVLSPGANDKLFGNRNAPAISYVKFNPDLFWNEEEALWMGGFFLDGREKTLQDQAGGPFLNPLEMGNTNKQQVVDKVKASAYASMVNAIYGKHVWDDSVVAFNSITDAIVAYEKGPEFALFNSKYDLYLQGKLKLTEKEQRGLELFEAEDKGNCAACHPSQLGENGEIPLFTDYSYDNLGVPSNKELAFFVMDKKYNPDGENYKDQGLALNPHINTAEKEAGKFKVPSLRNIAITGPYMHNGVFDTLEEVVDFYNTRDKDKKWPSPEVADNVNDEELGDLGLTDEEVDAIVAFLETLTDNYER